MLKVAGLAFGIRRVQSYQQTSDVAKGQSVYRSLLLEHHHELIHAITIVLGLKRKLKHKKILDSTLGEDPYKLDADGDRLACESLP